MLKELENKIFPFKFRCVRCGKCCTQMLTGVPLYYTDIKNISCSIGLKMNAFVKQYCELTLHQIRTGKKILNIPILYLKTTKGKCIFYKSNGCTVHNVKPYCCSAAPFISLLFQDYDMIDFFKKQCNGFGHGTYYNKRKIKQILKKEVELEETEWQLFNNGLYSNLVMLLNGKGGKNDPGT